MTTKIRVLSDHTINQIAAGEVIENPSSVVKELVENSLDAGSRKITIEIVGGGFLSIRIEDDGEGMSPDDAYLAFERHATSKLTALEDLMHITSMGFRGEALASIAAVSKVDLETSNGKVATRIGCYGGKIVYQEPTARLQGTTITVNSLFYNVPARKKFQKTAGASTAEIVKMCMKLALAHKGVSFKLFSHDKLLLKTEGKKDTILREVLGDSFLINTHTTFLEEEGHTIEGVVLAPSEARQNRSLQYLFINRRPVFSPFVAKAVKEAFGTRIDSHDYPAFALWITLPSKNIDVNVHPQKSEVRFQYEEMVERLIKKAVRAALTEMEGVDLEPFSFEQIALPPEPLFKMISREPPPLKQEIPEFFPVKQEKRVHVLGLIDRHAIIRVEEELVFLLDLGRASARVQFEEIMKRLQGEESIMQTLLFPKTLEFTKQEALILETHLELLEKFGIGMRPFGKECFIIDAIAPFFDIEDVHHLITLFIEDLRLRRTSEEMAKKAAGYGRKKRFTENEIRPIFLSLLKTGDPYYAPDGGKIMVLLDEKVLGKLYE